VSNDPFMRRVLRTTAVFNFGGALLFAFPASLGQVAGLPAPAPHVYTAFLAFLVVLFGATYAWLARQPRIDRPLVAFAAAGKAGFFAVVSLCWLFGEVPGRAVLGAGGDLVFALIFVWWLLADTATPEAAVHASAAQPEGWRSGAS
jgi:hypothetical protein